MAQPMDSRACALIAARAASDLKAHDILVQHVADKLHETDYFVICTVTSKPQLNGVTDEVREKVRASSGRSVDAVEGAQGGAWVLLDYGDFVVHVMTPEARAFYRLEAVWNDAPFLDLAAEGIELNEPYSEQAEADITRAGYEQA